MNTPETENSAAVGGSELSVGLGALIGIAAWDVGHGQPDKPDIFECEEHYFHFPCGMCKHKSDDQELHCAGCRHYCP